MQQSQHEHPEGLKNPENSTKSDRDYTPSEAERDLLKAIRSTT